jgi:rRNA maturation RNase YbeY
MKLLVRYNVSPQPVSPAWLKRLSAFVLKDVKGPAFAKRSELSVVLAGDGEVVKLNRRYRKRNRTTDVLAFPLLEGVGPRKGPADKIALGDVVISVPQARRQAKENGVPLRREMALLLTHGILHLLGYDHETKAQEKRMFGLQERLLKKL